MHDDLEITLRDAQMRGGRIVSPHAVQFRFGRSHGSGRDLEIQLASAEGNESTSSVDASSVRSLQLKHEVRMFLDVGSSPAASGLVAKPEWSSRRWKSRAPASSSSWCRNWPLRSTRM